MLINLDIIAAAARYRSRAELSTGRRDYVDRLVEKYEEACRMSTMNPYDERPGVIKRRADWERKARDRSAELCLVISYCHSHEEECCGR